MAIYKEDIVDVELTNGVIHRSMLCRTIGEGDAMANRFGVRVKRNREAVDLTGITCTGYFIRSTGDTVIITGAATGNTAYVTLPQACYAYEGQFALAIKLQGNGVTGTIRIVDGVVSNTQTGSAVDPGTIIPTIDALIEAIEDAVNSIPSDYSYLSKAVADYNCVPYPYIITSTTDDGITVTNKGNGVFHISGTATQNGNINIIDSRYLGLYDGFNAGQDIYYVFETQSNNEPFVMQMWSKPEASGENWSKFEEIGPRKDYRIASLPSDSKGFLCRIKYGSGETYDEDFKFFVLNKSPYFNAAQNALNITDLNKVHGNALWLMTDDNNYTHKPFTTKDTGFLQVYRAIGGWELQILYPFMGREGSVYMRRGDGSDNGWQPWRCMCGAKHYDMPDCDLNSADIEDGWYLLSDGHTYTNKPSGFTIGFLFQIYTGNWRLQVLFPFSGGIIYKRRGDDDGSSWEGWNTVSGGETYNITNEYSFPEYSQTVTLNASPTITTDTNNYLASTGDTTDRTADIMTMLAATGICRLGPGKFYVSNLQMPVNSAIIGSGFATEVRLAGTSDGYAIKMNSCCIVKDLKISGADSDLSFTSTIGGRHGILWQGQYTEQSSAPNRGTISDVWIINFSGGGITCYDTGYGTITALEVVNAWIMGCWAGINVSYWSEFNKFTNVRCAYCYVGCVNNGGNNVFVNCDFSSSMEIAMLMDNSQGQSPNNTHGSCIGCVFNHTRHAGASNSGIGIKILNCHSGFMFTGCQIYYSQIYLENTDGIVIADTNFGYENCDVTISGGGAVMFANNMTEGDIPVSITNNGNVHFANCYNKSTGAAWSA